MLDYCGKKIAERSNISVNVELLGVPDGLDQRQADVLERMAKSSIQYKKAKDEYKEKILKKRKEKKIYFNHLY
jgi:hypothetical protein